MLIAIFSDIFFFLQLHETNKVRYYSFMLCSDQLVVFVALSVFFLFVFFLCVICIFFNGRELRNSFSFNNIQLFILP